MTQGMPSQVSATAAVRSWRESPKSATIKQYAPYHKRWAQWCHRRGYADGGLVTENRLLAFLQEDIVRASSVDVNDSGMTGTPPMTPQGRIGKVSPNTASCVVSAIVKLWKTQCEEKRNDPQRHPRGPAVKAYLEMLHSSDIKRKREGDSGSAPPAVGRPKKPKPDLPPVATQSPALDPPASQPPSSSSPPITQPVLASAPSAPSTTQKSTTGVTQAVRQLQQKMDNLREELLGALEEIHSLVQEVRAQTRFS